MRVDRLLLRSFWRRETVAFGAVVAMVVAVALLGAAYGSKGAEATPADVAIIPAPTAEAQPTTELQAVAAEPQMMMRAIASEEPTPQPEATETEVEVVALASADVLVVEVADASPVETLTPLDEVATAAPAAYTVVAGDTLLGIAMQFDVPMAAIQLQNDLGEATSIRLGQVLEIPPAAAWSHATRFWTLYQVAAGETLGAIASRYGLDVAALQDANPGLNVDRLSIGQALILPLRGPAAVPARASAQPTAAPQAATLPAEVSVAEVEPEAAAVEAEVVEAQPPAAPAPPADTAALASAIFRLVNAERAAHGLPALAWDATLARAAQRHADDCYARGWCSHYGSDGSTYRTRIIREGYNPVRWSECWAWYETPERAVAMWMNEVPPNDPHRRTILNPALTQLGVGVVPGNGRGYYFIADFGTPAP